MHPFKPQLDGKDLSNIQDPNGKYLFKEMVKVVQQNGSGFVEYYWPKPGFDEPVAKMSYVELFSPWNWVIGSGVYLNDVEDLYAAKRNMLAVGFFILWSLFH